MECCRDDGPPRESVSTKPCCDFQMSAMPGPPPAVISPNADPDGDSRAADPAAEEISIPVPQARFTHLMATGSSPPGVGDPPLFILNASLLR